MNTQTTPPDPTPAADPALADLQTATVTRRLRGKIPSLPKEQRDTINVLLLDGATYATIIRRMAEQGVHLNAENLSNWFQTGFQTYLAHLERLDFQRARYEAAVDQLRDTDTSRLPQAGLHAAAAQIYDLLGHFAPLALAQNIADDPDKYTRIVNALSHLARQTLALQKYQDTCTETRAAAQERKDPKRKLTQRERRAIVRQVDEILGLGSAGDGQDKEEENPQAETRPVLRSRTAQDANPEPASAVVPAKTGKTSAGESITAAKPDAESCGPNPNPEERQIEDHDSTGAQSHVQDSEPTLKEQPSVHSPSATPKLELEREQVTPADNQPENTAEQPPPDPTDEDLIHQLRF